MQIKERCIEFMEEQINVRTWSDFLKLGERYGVQEFREKTVNFVFDNFGDVSRTVEFMRLPKDIVCYFLSSDFIKTKGGEIEVFRTAKSWIEEEECRIGFMCELMRCVRFPMIPNQLLKDEVLGWHKLYKEPRCAAMVTEALHYHNEIYMQPLRTGKQYVTRGTPGVAVVFAGFRGVGFSVENTSTDVFLFTSKLPSMAQPCSLPFAYRSLTCVTKGNFLFVLGTDSNYFGPVNMRYDVNNNKWMFLATPNISGLIGASAICIGKDIYLLGGILVDKTSDYKFDHDLCTEMYRYSIKDNRWFTVNGSFPQGHDMEAFYVAFGACASWNDDTICLAGGYNPKMGTVNSLRVYNVKENAWYTGTDMHYKRSNFLLEYCPERFRLFAVGGLALNKNGQVLRPVSLTETFDRNINQWTVLNTVINISGASSHFKNGVMYIIGGYRGSKNEDVSSDAILKFDTKNDVLVTTTNDSYPLKCPIPCIHHGSAFVTIPPIKLLMHGTDQL